MIARLGLQFILQLFIVPFLMLYDRFVLRKRAVCVDRDDYGFVTFRHAGDAYHAIESKLKYC